MMRIVFLLLTLVFCTACERKPHWTDKLEGCLDKPEIALLTKSLKNFEKVLHENAKGKTLTDKYIHFLKEVEKRSLLPDYYHHLLIKETTKKMIYSDFYEQMWQESSQWILNDGEGTSVYIINGFGSIPECLGNSSDFTWFKGKIASYKEPVSKGPGNLARELLNKLEKEQYDQPQLRTFIALSLCYQLALPYYRESEY